MTVTAQVPAAPRTSVDQRSGHFAAGYADISRHLGRRTSVRRRASIRRPGRNDQRLTAAQTAAAWRGSSTPRRPAHPPHSPARPEHPPRTCAPPCAASGCSPRPGACAPAPGSRGQVSHRTRAALSGRGRTRKRPGGSGSANECPCRSPVVPWLDERGDGRRAGAGGGADPSDVVCCFRCSPRLGYLWSTLQRHVSGRWSGLGRIPPRASVGTITAGTTIKAMGRHRDSGSEKGNRASARLRRYWPGVLIRRWRAPWERLSTTARPRWRIGSTR